MHERDHTTDALADPIPLVAGLEIALPKHQVVPAKGMAAVHGTPRPAQGFVADVHRIDAEVLRRQACIQERHGERVRLFTGRAGQAQYPEHGVLINGEPLSYDIPPEIREGHLVPKEPGFRDNHLVNEGVQFLF